MNIERVATVAAQECVRQQVGLLELGNLIHAYRYAHGHGIGEEADIKILGTMIEPRNVHQYRVVPVTFRNGGSSARPDTIDHLMSRLVDEMFGGGSIGVDAIVKEFLWIHPFVDGNGRTGWILYNYLNGTMDEPTNLPDFFGDVHFVS